MINKGTLLFVGSIGTLICLGIISILQIPLNINIQMTCFSLSIAGLFFSYPLYKLEKWLWEDENGKTKTTKPTAL